MRMIRQGRDCGPGGRRWLAAVVAALAAAGVLGMIPSAVQASSGSDLVWTRQHPAVHPPARYAAAIAYDAATGTAVLFGGTTNIAHVELGDTWTWDGTTWTQQHPATSPPAREYAAMAYDAATGTVVLFGGGNSRRSFAGTWTWDGTTWTRQHPATSPPAGDGASMAYDAATGTVVLFGGCGRGSTYFDGTWTWDGTTWTKQTPTVHPSARCDAAMAYDGATGTEVLFSGTGRHGFPGDTWTWDGTTWTQQHPATHPSGRAAAAMAYDPATGTVVLLGGLTTLTTHPTAQTWIWDGTAWTRQAPAVHPTARLAGSMAYDAATGTVVLFGGVNLVGVGDFEVPLGGTWTWG
jgi:hypothetical protein